MSCGCSNIESYVEDPSSMLRDPRFTQHEQQMHDLERAYLYKEIPYTEYLEKKKRLEDTYAREIQHRQDTIETNQQ